jgi:hypothetical protein
MSDQRVPLSDRAIQTIAENKILASIESGKFDDLPGFGKPAHPAGAPYDPHWWIRHKLRSAPLTEIEIEARAISWTAGATNDDIINHYKRFVDREKLRKNLMLTPDERLRQFERSLKVDGTSGHSE